MVSKQHSRLKPSGFFRALPENEGRLITQTLANEFAQKVSDPFLRNELLAALRDPTFRSIVRFRDLPPDSSGPSDYTWARRCIGLFKKDASLDLGIDTEQAAWEKFCEAELRCAVYNKHFRNWRSREKLHPRVNAWIHQVSQKITTILGECPSLDALQGSFGPGANTSCKRKTTARWKLSSRVSVSNEAPSSSLEELRACYEPWLKDVEYIRECGELSFVPKTCLTKRTIMVEPLLNTFVQRGIGRVIKRRLLHHGVNLYDQGVNRARAKVGSLTGDLATLDLSSASDLICWYLVFLLLPREWFDLLNDWRTGRVSYKKKSLEFNLEKFSSMGNGYTFELESLIFYSVCHVACTELGIEPDVSVYGDDLIVPTEAYPHVCEMLDAFGFSVNTEKSFASGPFRESCGGDYLSGIDTRPFYKKDRWTPARLVGLYNNIVRSDFSDDDVLSVIERFVPKHFRLYGPDGFGDGHLLSDSFVGKPANRNRGYCGFTFETFVKRASRDETPVPGDSLLPAYTAYCYSSSLPSSVDWHPILGSVTRLEGSDLFGDSRETDRFAIRGGESGRKVRIYTLN